MTTRIFRILALTMGVSATAAYADQHEILLVEGGFFPEITYLAVGDTVTFVNLTDVAENVVASDASWSTSQIGSELSEALVITAEMTLSFAYDEGSDAPKLGSFSLDPAPLGSVIGE